MTAYAHLIDEFTAHGEIDDLTDSDLRWHAIRTMGYPVTLCDYAYSRDEDARTYVPGK